MAQEEVAVLSGAELTFIAGCGIPSRCNSLLMAQTLKE
jgi:hypothetical protein